MIDSTQFSSNPDILRERTYRAIDNDPVIVDKGADFGFYDHFERKKIDHHTVTNRASATGVILGEIPSGWCHEKIEIERTLHVESSDFK